MSDTVNSLADPGGGSVESAAALQPKSSSRAEPNALARILRLASWAAVPVAVFAQARVDPRNPQQIPEAALLYLVAAGLFAYGFGRQALESSGGGPDAEGTASSGDAASALAHPLATVSPLIGAVMIAASFLFFGDPNPDTLHSLLWVLLWGGGALMATMGMSLSVTLGTMAVIASYRFFGQNQVTAPGVILWLGGLVAMGLGFGAVQPLVRRLWSGLTGTARNGLRLSPYALVLLLILIAAAGLRFWQLDQLPGELGVDLPINYRYADQIIQGNFPVFTPAYPGREALFFYFVALIGRIFGLWGVTTKIAGAIVGMAAIVATYFAGKELFNREVGLWAALLLAISKWALIISRSGLRLGQMPLFIAVFLWALSRALRTRRQEYYCLLGLILGLGMYTYNAWYMVIPLVGLLLVLQPLIWKRRPTLQDLSLIAAMLVVAFLVFVPEFRYAHDYPDSFSFRVATRITGQEVPLPANVLAVFLDNLKRSLLMFNYAGDSVAVINVPFQRELGLLSAAAFVLGIAYALVRLRRGLYASLLIAIVVMLLPTALSIAFPNEVPSAGRASGTIVPAILLAALPLALVRQRAWNLAQNPAEVFRLSISTGEGQPLTFRLRPLVALQVLVLVFLAGGILLEASETWDSYFRQYAFNLEDHNWSISKELAETTDRFLPTGRVIIVFQPYWYDGNALHVNLQSPPDLAQKNLQELLDPLALDKPPLVDVSGKFLFVIKADDLQDQKLVETAFPKAIKVDRLDYQGQPQYYEYYGQR